MSSIEASITIGPHVVPFEWSELKFRQPLAHAGRPAGRVQAGGLWLLVAAGHASVFSETFDTAHGRQWPTAQVHYHRTDGGSLLGWWNLEEVRCVGCALSFDSRGRGAAPSEFCRVLLVARYWSGAHGRFDAWSGRLVPVSGPEPWREALLPVIEAPTPGLKATPGLVMRPLLKNDADPVYDLLGPGRVSHPQEWEETIAMLKEEGVRVVFRAGVMAYGPDSAPGQPGQLILDPEASIAAMRHEAQHYADDKALGFPGSATFYKNPLLRWRMEYAAYRQEVLLVRQLKAFDIGFQLVGNARDEKKYLHENFGPF